MTTDDFHSLAAAGPDGSRPETARAADTSAAADAAARRGSQDPDEPAANPYSASEQDEVAARLEALGYLD